MAEILKLSHLAQQHGVPEVDVRRGRIETPEDLIADLEAGFERLNRAADTAGDGG